MSPLKTTHLDSPDIEMALAKESSSSDTANQSKDADTLLHMKNSSCYSSPKVDPKKNRFPFCLVWSPLPIISWFLPFIGHLGIADSKGIIFDFAGSYTIGKEHFAFGIPTRYLQLDVQKDQVEKWDKSIQKGCKVYETRIHNLFCDNCHSHVAECLNQMQFLGYKHWNMVILCFWVFFCGKYVNFIGFFKSWIPFCLVLSIFLLVK